MRMSLDELVSTFQEDFAQIKLSGYVRFHLGLLPTETEYLFILWHCEGYSMKLIQHKIRDY
jgi:hypothetical protein